LAFKIVSPRCFTTKPENDLETSSIRVQKLEIAVPRPLSAQPILMITTAGAAPDQVSKAFALTWYRALTWYSSPAQLFAALDVPLLVTSQQESPSPACRQLTRARNACAGGSRERGTKLKHGAKLGRTLCYWPLKLVSLLNVLRRNPRNELEKSQKLEIAVPRPLSTQLLLVITTAGAAPDQVIGLRVE